MFKLFLVPISILSSGAYAAATYKCTVNMNHGFDTGNGIQIAKVSVEDIPVTDDGKIHFFASSDPNYSIAVKIEKETSPWEGYSGVIAYFEVPSGSSTVPNSVPYLSGTFANGQAKFNIQSMQAQASASLTGGFQNIYCELQK